MLAGISTACFYPEHTEDALAELCSLRPQCVEIFANCDYEMTLPYCRELRLTAENSGVKISSLHPYSSYMEPLFFLGQYARRFTQGRDLYKRYYEAASELGAKILVFHGATYGGAPDRQLYFERYAVLLEDARSFGIELCHENVCRCESRSPDFFRDMRQYLPDAGIVFDVKQAVRSGENVMDFADTLGSGIRHVHISDHDQGRDCLPPGQGVFNIPDFLSLIAKNGFDGSVIVELYRHNFDNIVELNAAYQHLLPYLFTNT